MSESRYKLILESLPDQLSREQVCKLVRHEFGLSQEEAAELVDKAPVTLRDDLSEEEANRLKRRLIWCGAQASVEPPAPADEETVKAAAPPHRPETEKDAPKPPPTPPSRVELGVASPAETRVERLRKTLQAQRQEGPRGEPAFISPEAPPRTPPRSPAKRLAVALVALGLAVVFVIMWLGSGGRKPQSASPPQPGVAQAPAQQPTVRTDDAKYQAHMQAGVEAEDAGRLAEALKEYQEAVRIKSTGEARQAVTRMEEAIRAQQKPARPAPPQISPREKELLALIPQLKAEKAWTKWLAALEELKSIQGVRFKQNEDLKIAALYVQQEKLEKQRERLQEESREKARQWVSRAQVFLARGMTREAAQAARYALIAEPDNAEAQALLARCGGVQVAAPPPPAPPTPKPAKPTQPAAKPKPTVEPTTPKTETPPPVEPTPKPQAPKERREPAAPEKPAEKSSAPPPPAAPAKAKTFWPLASGDSWWYSSSRRPDIVIMRTIKGSELIGGEVYRVCLTVRRGAGQPETREKTYLSLRADGLFRRMESGQAEKLYPLPLRVGRRFAASIPGVTNSEIIAQPTTMSVSVEREERVVTPAGAFHCFVVVRKKRHKEFVRRTAQIISEQDLSVEWVCPGVGLVKQQRTLTRQVVKGKKEEKRETIVLTRYQIKTD